RVGDRRAQRGVDLRHAMLEQRDQQVVFVLEVEVDRPIRDAGVADGTIYLYFKNKDDLLISLFEHRMTQVNATLRAAIADAPPLDQLRAFIRTYLRLVADEPAAAE